MGEAAIQIGAPIQRVGTASIRLERLFEASPETLWDYLTRADLRQQWFMGGTDAHPGSEFELLVDHDQLSSESVPYPESYKSIRGRVFHERVLKFERPRLLVTTFQGGENGIVTYELTPVGDKTRLVLTHSEIRSASGFQDFGGGWTSHLAVLDELLAGRKVANFWDLHMKSRAAVAKALG